MSGGLINIVHVFPTDSFRRYRVSISHFLDELSQVQCYFSSDFYRPPDILVGKLRFYRDSFFLSFIFFRHLPTELAERNSTKTGHMLGSECGLNPLTSVLRLLLRAIKQLICVECKVQSLYFNQIVSERFKPIFSFCLQDGIAVRI